MKRLSEGLFYPEATHYLSHTVAYGVGCYANGAHIPEALMLNVGCVVNDGPRASSAVLTNIGPLPSEVSPEGWEPRYPELYCSWFAAVPHEGETLATRSTACLLPHEDSCYPGLQISYPVRQTLVPPGRAGDVSVSCERGILVGGSCSTQGDLASRLSRSGFTYGTDEANAEWRCSYYNGWETSSITITAMAHCVDDEQPAARAECGCCPSFGGRIVRRQATMDLGPDMNRLTVACDEGDKLVSGSCMLEGELNTLLAQLKLLRSGYVLGGHDAWDCSWNNPTTLTPMAVATAVCLDVTD